eukprot:1905073-Prymnesium_polylepis.1
MWEGEKTYSVDIARHVLLLACVASPRCSDATCFTLALVTCAQHWRKAGPGAGRRSQRSRCVLYTIRMWRRSTLESHT